MIAFRSHLADLGCRLSGNPLPFAQAAQAPDREAGSRVPEPVKTALAVPHASAVDPLLQDGEAASRLVHTQEIAGASPAPATRSEEEVVADPLLGKPLAAHGSDEVAAFNSVRQTIPGRSASAVRASDESTAFYQGPMAAGGTALVLPAPTRGEIGSGAVALSEASAFILSLVAAHEGRRPEEIMAMLIVGAAEAIGLHALIMRDAGDVDLADVPDFALRAANRFRPVLTARGASPLPPDGAPAKAGGLRSEPWPSEKESGGP